MAAGLPPFAILVAGVAISVGLDDLAERSFALHMLQHVLLAGVFAPIFLLAAPIRFALRTLPLAAAAALSHALHSRFVRALTHPLVAWGAFIVTLWAMHFSPLYDAALERALLHALEHALLVGTALLFWAAVIDVAPMPVRLSYPGRLLYLFAAIPFGSFLGLALLATRRPLYPHYLQSATFFGWTPLEDQHAAGVVMWFGGSIVMLVALLAVAYAWSRSEVRAPVG